MSYILDALKRSQRERELGRIPGIAAEHLAGPGPAPARFGWGVAAGGLLGAAVAAAGLLLALRPWSGAVPAAPVQVVVAPVEAESHPPRTPPPVAPNDTPAPAPLALVTPPVPVAVQAPAPVSAVARPPVDAGSVPLLEELSQPIRSRIPELRLKVHVYAESPAARFVFINSALYHEGQTTREGALVEAITPEGAILSFGGTRFRTHL